MLKYFKSNRGVAFVEGALGLVLLLAVVSGFWGLHSLNDMRRNIAAAAFGILADPNLVPFSVDAAGNTVRWGDPGDTGFDFVLGLDAVTNAPVSGLSSLESSLVTQLDDSSKIFTMASNTSCKVAIGYLNILVPGGPSTPPANTWGNCCETAPPVGPLPRTIHPASIDTGITPIEMAMKNRADQYVSSLTGSRVNSQETLVLLDADSLPQFGSTTSTQPTPIYFPWAPFYLWGCEGDIALLFGLVPFNTFRWTGIVVPKR